MTLYMNFNTKNNFGCKYRLHIETIIISQKRISLQGIISRQIIYLPRNYSLSREVTAQQRIVFWFLITSITKNQFHADITCSIQHSHIWFHLYRSDICFCEICKKNLLLIIYITTISITPIEYNIFGPSDILNQNVHVYYANSPTRKISKRKHHQRQGASKFINQHNYRQIDLRRYKDSAKHFDERALVNVHSTRPHYRIAINSANGSHHFIPSISETLAVCQLGTRYVFNQWWLRR